MHTDLQKTVTLKNGKTAVIRFLDKKDKRKLRSFYQNLPESDRMFLKEDVMKPEVIDRWFKEYDNQKVNRIVAVLGNRIIAEGTLHISPYGWSRHVGDVRLVVAPAYRDQGIGKAILRELYFTALKLKVEKLNAIMMESHKQAINLFKGIGFVKEAVLKEHIKDIKSNKHDLIIMTHSVDTHWKELEDMIFAPCDDFSGEN